MYLSGRGPNSCSEEHADSVDRGELVGGIDRGKHAGGVTVESPGVSEQAEQFSEHADGGSHEQADEGSHEHRCVGPMQGGWMEQLGIGRHVVGSEAAQQHRRVSHLYAQAGEQHRSQGTKWGMYLHTWVCIHTFSRNWVCKRYVFDQKGM